jgi:hypothetical protein
MISVKHRLCLRTMRFKEVLSAYRPLRETILDNNVKTCFE